MGPATIEGAALGARDRTVLAVLALDSPHWVAAERLADALWGEDPPASRAKVVQGAVSRLRRVLWPGAIVSGPGGYRLDVPPEQIDVRQFERLVDLAARSVETDPSMATRCVEEAASLWRGRPFSDLGDWDLAAGKVSWLEERRRLLEVLRVEILVTNHRFDDAVADASVLVEEEPLDERRAALQATALYGAGRAVEALSALRLLRTRLRDDLGLEPGPELVALEVAILRHDRALLTGGRAVRTESQVVLDRRSVSGNNPAHLSTLFGRDDDLTDIDAAVRAERLVVLTGAGGVGKTRLALAAARRGAAGFGAGAWIVDLTLGSDPSNVASIVGDALGFVPSDGLTPDESVIAGISDRHMLLVLDNCEHMLDAVAGFVIDLLRRCARVRIIATSREPLGVEGEQVFVVTPLAIDTDAVELFIDRAGHVDRSFAADDRALIAEICRCLDGIPLGIELAAARVRELPLDDLRVRLAERLDTLTTRRRGGTDRHRTMRAAIDWSHNLLSGDERVAFSRLAVFAGSFDLAAAEAVIGSPPLHADVVDVLGALVDKSMVIASSTDRCPFRLLEPLRQYAVGCLVGRGELAEIAQRAGRYYADAAAVHARALGTSCEIEAARWFDAARANLRAAFSFAVASNDADLALRVVAPLAGYTNLHVWAAPWAWCRDALELPGADGHPLRAAVLVQASRGAWQLGDHDRALALGAEVLTLADAGTVLWAHAQINRASAFTFLGRLSEAEQAAISAVEAAADASDHTKVELTATMLLIRNLAGHPDPALASELLSRAASCGPSMQALALHTAAVVQGPVDRPLAIAWNQRAVDLARTSGAVLIEGMALAGLAAREADVSPASGARGQVEVMAHYLALGNQAHLRGFGRAIIVPLVECGAVEAAAVVDGATRGSATVLPTLIDAIEEAIDIAKHELGRRYELAAHRGELMTGDQLVDHARQAVSELTGSLST
jgi:predicted ATPase/DNA-binding SARP family transcriptional activator